jgi:outer membrane immunogenic protein
MRKFVVAATFFATSVVGAAAADLTVKAPIAAPAVVNDWTGFYIGINGGGDWGRANTGLQISSLTGFFSPGDAGTAIQNAGSNRINNSGGVAGGQIGYLIENGHVIMGLEASFDLMRANGSVSNNVGPGVFPAGFGFVINENVGANWLALFTGRVGLDMGNWYPYLTAGVAVASLRYSSTYLDNIPSAFASSFATTETTFGGAFGGGAEWKLDNHWSLRGEYTYLTFSGISGASPVVIAATGRPVASGVGTFFTYTHNAAFHEQMARVFVSYKFGADGVHAAY